METHLMRGVNKEFISQQKMKDGLHHKGILREVNMSSILNSKIIQQRVNQWKLHRFLDSSGC